PDGYAIGVRAEGAAHVFQRVPPVWQEAARLTGNENPDSFGASVAVSGTTVVVGAPGYPRNRRDPLHPPASPGVVCVFERDEGGPDQWGEVALLVGQPPFPIGFSSD